MASLVLAAATILFGVAGPAQAAANSVTITGPTTAQSGTTQTYTLAVTCSGTCGNTTVTFPTSAITGDGATTDFGSWVGAGTCSTLSVSGGQVTVSYANLGSGSTSCNFTISPPEYTTFNGAKITMTPTMTTGSGSATGSPTTLTVTAGHNDSLNKTAPAQVTAGASFDFTLQFFCGLNGQYTGDVGLSALTITDPLPANFTYLSSSTPGEALPGTLTYSAATHTLTYSDPSGKSCGDPPLNSTNVIGIKVTGSASTGGTPDAAGTLICNMASSTFTYLDGTPGSSTSPQVCPQVVKPAWNNVKAAFSTTLGNVGQYLFPGSTTKYPYTYPGDWDGTQTSSEFDVKLYDSTGSTNAGLDYAVQDPLPCLDNFAANVYSSNAPGTLCQHPAFIPTRILVQGFTPSAADPADVVTVLFADGTSQSVAYNSATASWPIPTAKPVAELDFPPFPEEGSNFGNIALRIQGYAASGTITTSLLTNTETGNAYPVGSATPISPAQQGSASLMVVSAAAPSGTVVYPNLSSFANGSCTENVELNNFSNGVLGNYFEVASVPSLPIYIDYLAPAGATGVNSGWTGQWKLAGVTNGKTFSTVSLSPAVTPNFNGTGRTRYEWVIPAGTATTGGVYQIVPPNANLLVNLGPGCAGTYNNDMTVGYGAPITSCVFDNYVSAHVEAPPMNPKADGDLNSNGVGTGNYCGYSAPLTVAPVNPAYTVDKVVQGNLDAAPVGGGGIGHVSPTGGTATYTLSFTNTGQSNLTNPVLYDLLPRVGDTEASSTVARNSKFAVTLTGIGPVPTGVTVYYSQAANPCRPEVLPNGSNPGCVNDWSTTAPAALSSVTALEFVYTGTVYVSGSTAGIHGFTIPYTVSTPTTAVGNVAWNSVGTSVLAGDNPMPPAESAYTGLAAQAAQPLVTKSANTSTYSKVGDTITYAFTVTNNTAVTLSPVTVTDKLTDAAAGDVAPTTTCQSLSSPAATCSGTSTSLAPNQIATFTATYTVNQADLDHGLITDQAMATAQPPTGGALVNSSSPVTVTAVQSPALTLTKSALPSTVTKAGDTVTYSFLVANGGNVTVDNVGINETAFSGTGTLSAISCPTPTLAPGAQETCTATYATTQADVDAGVVSNTATATGTSPSGPVVTSPPSTAVVTVKQTPALSLVKSADPSGPSSFTKGQVLTYHYLVTNTGDVTMSGIAITEGTFTGSGSISAISCPTTTLAPGAQVDCTATYTLTQADIDAGKVVNTAAATGTPPSGPPVTSPPSTVTTPATQNPVLTLAKTASPTTVAKVGDQVSYSFLVTNAGNVTLNNVAVNEGTFTGTGTMSAISCPTPTLIPGQQETCTATYSVTQADLNAGSVSNTATATGTPPSGPAVTASPSTARVAVATAPALTLAKTASPTTVAQAGETVTYSFLVTNTGNVTMTGIGITEGTFTGTGTPSAITCPTTTLVPGTQVTCTATYAVTQADIDAGTVSNTATATGTPPSGPAVTSPTSTATVTVDQSPGLTLTKTASPTTVSKAGDTVTYSFLMSNTGNVTLTGLKVQDSSFTGTGTLSAISCPTTTLAPGTNATCTATYAVTQADIDAGQVSNTATVTGTPPIGAPLTSPPSTATVTATTTPSLSLVKSADPAGAGTYEAGQVITYHYLITNTGDVTMTGVGIAEGTFTGSGSISPISCPTTTLAPGAQVDCTATYTLSTADINGGSISNTATATGNPPTGPPVSSNPSTVTTPAIPAPALTLVKSVTPTTVNEAGDVVSYSFLVSNTGNVTIHGVAIDETAFSGTGTLSAITCPTTTLVPGQNVTCTATYAVTQADVDASEVTNAATATGTPPTGTAVTSPTSTATVTIPAAPALTLAKTASPTTVNKAGDTVTYSFLVTNTGNVTVHGVAIDETAFSGTGTVSAISCPTTTLAPAATVTCTATYAVTQVDVDAGTVTNTATATANPPTGLAATSPSSTATVTIPAAPALTLAKTASPTTVNKAGDTVTYSFLVTNTGNVTVHGVAIDETAFSGTGTVSAISCPTTTLAPAATVTCTATYAVTQVDVDAGTVTNTATATANPPTGLAATSPSSTATVTIPAAPALTLAKTASPTTVHRAGDTVTYSFLVTNTGNVTLSTIKIDEGAFSGTGTVSAISCPTTTLAPAATVTCTATYAVTQVDVDAGTVTNTATATANPPTGLAATSPSSTATVTIPAAPALTLAKTASPTTVHRAGDTVTYSFLVTNTGNVTLSTIKIDEGAFTGTGTLSAISCPTTTLAPAATVTCTATYAVTQADMDAGSITNTATATGTDPKNNPVTSPTSTATVSAAAGAAITLVKTANTTTITHTGQQVGYSFVVTNTGNVTLTHVSVKEGTFSGSGTLSGISCPTTTLAPGAKVTCTASYTVTAKDLTAAALTNTAVVTGNYDIASVSAAATSEPSTAKVAVQPSSAPPAGGGSGSAPASTGTDVLGMGGIALTLLLAGGLVLFFARRRTRA